MWLLLAGLALLTGDVLSQGFVQFQSAPLTPIAPIAFHHRPVVRPTINRFQTFGSTLVIRGDGQPPGVNPCQGDPCGPYTNCRISNQGVAQCSCIDGYIPDGNTVIGCKPQCTSNSDCTDDFQCRGQRCVRVCEPGVCGLHADCKASRHVARCSCPSNYHGNADVRCTRVVTPLAPRPAYVIDPCGSNPCGTNAVCRTKGDRASCSCPVGYYGDPIRHCERGECTVHSDCRSHLACQDLKCINPCTISNICGIGADCTTRNNKPICSCPQHYIGNPFEQCRRITERDVCKHDTCGSNTDCKVNVERSTGAMRATCSCKNNYIGHPLRGCRYECVSSSECAINQQCSGNRCRNPCSVDLNACGKGAICNTGNHRAICTCHQYFQGDAYSSGCYAECTEHSQCSSHKACIRFECKDPCEGACGLNADCKVENHAPICSCPKDHTGHPFESCRPFTTADLCRNNPCGTNADCTPGKDQLGNDRPVCTCPTGYIGNPLQVCERGNCEDHRDCPNSQACYGYVCQSPCIFKGNSVCGVDADCNVKNHKPVCSCPSGYVGSPLEHCTLSRHAILDFVAGHSRA